MLDSLKNKKLLLANWGCADKENFQCRDWIPFFEKLFGKLIVFSLKRHYYFYGKESLNEKFLNIIKKEKPDYLIFGHRYDEIYLDTLKKIKELSPETKTIIEFGDDDFRFDDWGRYYALFFDYIITTKKELSIYKKDKIKNAFSMPTAINPDFFRPMNLEKKYDVTFIGRPIADRYDYIKFLIGKGINIKIFGGGWDDYSDLKKFYKGVLYSEDYPKTINQTKINLSFSKTLYKKGKSGQFKGRTTEVTGCNSFLLTEYTDKNLEFFKKRKEVNFENKEELLEKIKYYLKHEDERKKIAEEFYQYILKNWTWEVIFTKFFRKIEKNKSKEKKLPQFNKKIASFSKKEVGLPLKEIKEKLKNIDYIHFTDKKCKTLPNKRYFQAYSLYISKKQISCCDYYVYSKNLENYLIFKTKETFNTFNKKKFYNLLNINQIMADKDYFLKNFNAFKKLFNKEPINIIKEENTVFISIPLIRINKPPFIDYKNLKKAFYMLFRDKLFSLIYQKKIFAPYIFKLFKESLSGKFFIIKYLSSSFNLKENISILKKI